MTPEMMKTRTKRFGLRVISFVASTPRHFVTDTLTRQLVRSATSVGANYRAACRAKSSADFINKMKIVEEEADESAFWLELLDESGLVDPNAARDLCQEANEIVAITVASINTRRNSR